MRTSAELRQERQGLLDDQANLITEARSNENGVFTEPQQTRWDSIQTQVEDLDAQIATAVQREAVLLERSQRQGVVVTPGAAASAAEEREYSDMVREYSLHRAMQNQIQGRAQSGVEAEIQQELTARAADAGVNTNGLLIPTPEGRADQQTVTQDSGNYGANLVAEDLQAPINFLRPNPVLRQMGATYLTGLRGNVAFPVNKGGIAATWEGEVATVAASKNQYDKKSMSPKRLAATVGLSLQNILQANIDLERYTIDEINRVVSNAIDTAGINGPSGSATVPEGILNATGTGSVAAGTNGGAPTWAHIVGLESEVMNANYTGTRYGYLINTGTKGKLKNTKHEAGDLGYLMSVQNEINGYGVGVSNLVPNDLTKGTGTALNAGIFGDFSQLLIGQWGFMDMVIDNITGAKSGIVEVTVNSFLDIMLRHPEAFAVVKDWDIS